MIRATQPGRKAGAAVLYGERVGHAGVPSHDGVTIGILHLFDSSGHIHSQRDSALHSQARLRGAGLTRVPQDYHQGNSLSTSIHSLHTILEFHFFSYGTELHLLNYISFTSARYFLISLISQKPQSIIESKVPLIDVGHPYY